MKDERIQTTVNRFAAGGFFIWQLLLSISLCYRTLILKQHPREWWDIFAIFCIGTFFVSIAYANKGLFDHVFKRTCLAISIGVFIAYANKGVFGHRFKRFWLTICIFVLIGIFTVFFIMGRIHSLADVAAVLIGFLPAMGLVIAIAHFLNRRWKRKEGIEDEK